ncbi:DUF3847 domain-containing protein, partial [Dysosmobacter welbionis]
KHKHQINTQAARRPRGRFALIQRTSVHLQGKRRSPMKKHLQDSLVIGFALFSMFFGAGNVIFPPYLGLESGPEWLAGFFSYFMADIGLALLAMFAILRQ